MAKKSHGSQSVYVNKQMKTYMTRVKFSQLITQETRYQYRDPAEMGKDDEYLKKLSQKISAAKGNDNPILVKPDGKLVWHDAKGQPIPDGEPIPDNAICTIPDSTKLIVIDGHRRYTVIGDLIAKGQIEGFTPDMLVKVDIITNDVPDVELVIRSAALNTTQKTWGDFGRIKAAVALHDKYGITDRVVLGNALGQSETNVKRVLS